MKLARTQIKKKAEKSGRKKSKSTYYLAALAVIMVILFFYTANYLGSKKSSSAKDVMASINGEEITLSELEELYLAYVPDSLKGEVTKLSFLDNSIIPQRLLLQEAEKKSITASDEEVDESLSEFLKARGTTLEEFKSRIEAERIKLNDVKESFKENIKITKLTNETILSMITVSDDEVRRFYDNYDEFSNVSFEVVKEKIREQLRFDKEKRSFNIYISQLRKDADIQMYIGKNPISFEVINGEVCIQDGKPIIRVFTTSKCIDCIAANYAFDSAAKQYSQDGKIAAYHWELDTGNNALTALKEKGIPQSEVDLFKKYSPDGKAPLYLLGCRYKRIGNYYGNDPELEEADFRAAINSIIE